jgi:hypothetical protein
MKKYFYIIFLSCLFSANIFSQAVNFNTIKQEYEAFEYERVIQLSDVLIRQGGIPDSLLIEVHLMRAVSFYTIPNEGAAQNSFREILKINKNYQPDPSKISPKLISIFNDVKVEYLRNLKPDETPIDSTQQSRKTFSTLQIKSSMLKNVILPGWGQLAEGNTLKGIILTSASAINLASLIYFVIDTNRKETDYLKETNKVSIREKYDLFNKSYKIRNTLIATYIIIWLYSQLDLFLMDGNGASSSNFELPVSMNNLSWEFSLRIPISK